MVTGIYDLRPEIAEVFFAKVAVGVIPAVDNRTSKTSLNVT